MASLSTAIALAKSRFITQWEALHSDIPVVWTNDPIPEFDQPGPVVHVEVNGGVEDIIAFGGPQQNLYRSLGEVIIRVLVPQGSGDELVRDLADDAASIFRGWSSGELRFYGVSTRDDGVDGGWYMLEVIASFENDQVA